MLRICLYFVIIIIDLLLVLLLLVVVVVVVVEVEVVVVVVVVVMMMIVVVVVVVVVVVFLRPFDPAPARSWQMAGSLASRWRQTDRSSTITITTIAIATISTTITSTVAIKHRRIDLRWQVAAPPCRRRRWEEVALFNLL